VCMEDIKLGRELAPAAFRFSPAGGSASVFLPADPLRTRIVVSSDGTNTVWIAPEGLTPANLVGFCLNAGYPRMEIRVEDWGRLVQGAWTVFPGAGNPIIAVMVATLERQR
jgi:hypothetical protein